MNSGVVITLIICGTLFAMFTVASVCEVIKARMEWEDVEKEMEDKE